MKPYTHNYSKAGYPDAGTLTLIAYPTYTVYVKYEEGPSNPLEDTDCEPPVARYSERWEGFTVLDIWNEIPEEPRKAKWKEILCAVNEYDGNTKDQWYANRRGHFREDTLDAVANALREVEVPAPSGWRSAEHYCDMLADVCRIAGLHYHTEVSRGYSQGDAIRLFCYAPPSWINLVGAPEESLDAQLKSACDLYGAWAWGDVYGVSEITRADSTEIEDGSCWGFYGTDFEKSGLIEFAQEAIENDIAWLAREAKESMDAACRDIVTV